MIYMEKRKKGKTCERKYVGSWVGVSRDGLKYPLRTSSLHASFNVLCGRCQGDFWYGSQPSSWSPHPSNNEIDFGCTTMEPPKLHIHLLDPMGDNSFIGNSHGCRVIGLDRSFWLGPTHGDEGLAVGDHFSCSDE
jgi:hypothetical protein